MKALFIAQWLQEKRNPGSMLFFIVLSVALTVLFGGTSGGKMKIDVIADNSADRQAQAEWLRLLNAGDSFAFVFADEDKALRDIREGRKELAVRLLADDYRIVAAVAHANMQAVDRHLRTVMGEELRLRAAIEANGDESRTRADIEKYMARAPLRLDVVSPFGPKAAGNEMMYQLLFGFMMFFSMYAIGYKVNAVLKEKENGMWNRVILSPVSKTRMYLGHLGYCFVVGFVQIASVLLIFRFAVGVDFGPHELLLLPVAALYAVVSISVALLLAGLARTSEQYNILLQIVVPIMPIVAGVYFPPGVVTNRLLLGASELLPIKHGLDAMKQIAMFGPELSDLALPVAKLALIGVMCIGVGINAIERRRV